MKKVILILVMLAITSYTQMNVKNSVPFVFGFTDTVTSGAWNGMTTWRDTLSRKVISYFSNTMFDTIQSFYSFSIIADDTIEISIDSNFVTKQYPTAGNFSSVILPNVSFYSGELDRNRRNIYIRRYGTAGTPRYYLYVRGW